MEWKRFVGLPLNFEQVWPHIWGSEANNQVKECLWQLAHRVLPANLLLMSFQLQLYFCLYKIGYDINGLNFHGVNITPTPAYEQISRVIIDRAHLHMQDNCISSALVAYGRVVGVQHLTVLGFPNVRTGTRMVSMSILKPIPMELTIKFCFGCRSFGHLSRLCPKLSGRSKGQSHLVTLFPPLHLL